ncbi:MAG: bifunctional folylpolyglutamate synthase/dihydrofolate synthase [Lachnospiraceae bacterium]|nr:bifunctional folylpolyglutamate synthase/dihydrofolate synthase [Lachnospiraceae bacterium]
MIRRNITSFEEAEQYLNDTPKFTTKHSIEATREFLEKMGSPDEAMKIIHVAGTNGKGSTCAYLTSILREAGFCTALFTSPHLVDICERFSIDGVNMTHEEFLESFNCIYNMLDWDALAKDEGYHPSYFEFLFFMAMHYFSEKKVEWCVLETGLGGLLDATNSVHHKEAAVITRIGLDHMEYLGETIYEIAGQKAGIIAKGVPLVYNDYVPEASKAITEAFYRVNNCDSDEKCDEVNVRKYAVGENMLLMCENQSETVAFSMTDGYYNEVQVSLDTVAAYQTENAMLAIRTIEAVGLCGIISAEKLTVALGKCHWAGRMEEIIPNVFIDGAHNPDGIRAFLETVSRDGLDKSRRSLLFGVVADKNFYRMLEELVEAEAFYEMTITPLHTKRSADISQLREALAKYDGITVKIADDPEKGLREMISARGDNKDKRIYVAGSLYLVGEIKKAFMDEATAV